MALSDEEKETLKSLQEKAAAAEKEESDFEVEVWDEKGKGGRLPYSKARRHFQSMGIDVDDPPAESSDKSEENGDGKDKSALRHFRGKTSK